MGEKAMVLFSGGIDSTTCLALAIEKYGKENVIPLSISYGQKHEKEVEAARKILEYYGIKGMEMDLTSIFAYSDCSLLTHSQEEIPEASYGEQLAQTGIYLCAFPKRPLFVLCCQSCPVPGLPGDLLWGPQR
mgnify:CR=1 FL=1